MAKKDRRGDLVPSCCWWDGTCDGSLYSAKGLGKAGQDSYCGTG